jgi:hypothetical protein
MPLDTRPAEDRRVLPDRRDGFALGSWVRFRGPTYSRPWGDPRAEVVTVVRCGAWGYIVDKPRHDVRALHVFFPRSVDYPPEHLHGLPVDPFPLRGAGRMQARLQLQSQLGPVELLTLEVETFRQWSDRQRDECLAAALGPPRRRRAVQLELLQNSCPE